MAQLEPDLPSGYADALAEVKEKVREAQHRAHRIVNAAMIELYWNIGRTILERQTSEPWGNKVLERFAGDLRSEFPNVKGFSLFRTNQVVEQACLSGPLSHEGVPHWDAFHLLLTS